MHNRHLLTNALNRTRFADELVDYLIKLGVGYLFGMPAESVNSLVHAASRRDEIQLVTTRHESAAALMAVQYARSTGRLGVCFGTAGPGATNLLVGAHEAFLARVPLLAITGQVPVAGMGRNTFQEIDSETLFKSCTASSVQISAASQFERFARSAVTALHESTACHVAVPGDVLYAPLRADGSGIYVPQLPAPELARKEEISAVVDLLASDDPAIVLCNASRSDAALAEALAAQVGCALSTTGTTAAKDVLIVGRSSPLLTARVHRHANLLELTDRRHTAKSLPYTRRIVCDVGATLGAVLDAAGPSAPDSAVKEPQIFSDLDSGETLLPVGDHPMVASRAGIAGAALPLAIGAAYAGACAVVVTDDRQFGQFVADLSSLAGATGNLVVACRTDNPSQAVDLGAAFGLRTGVAKDPAQLSQLVGEFTATQEPAFIAVAQGAVTPPQTPASQPGEQALASHLDANLDAPLQISEFCAPLLPAFATAQRSANAQAPSISASALRKSGAGCVATVAATGPALLLQLNGIYDAALDGSRILVVTVETQDWSVDAGQVLDGVSVARYVADDPATAAATVQQACAAAADAGYGVVHLQVRQGALAAEWDSETPRVRIAVRPASPAQSAVDEARNALRGARRVAIVAGRGAVGCSNVLTELSGLLDAPVHLTMGGDSALQARALRAAGRIGASGDLRAFGQVSRADVLLMVGVSNRGSAFDPVVTGPTIMVNLDPHAMLNLGAQDICVLGDARSTLEMLVQALRTESPIGTGRSRRAARRRRVSPRGQNAPLRASRLVQAVDEELARLDGISTVCADVGVNTLWVYRYITSMTRSLWSASFGTMGFAVPAAITVAKNSAASEVVIAIAGDGGTSVVLNQIRSSAGVNKPLVFIVVNNLALAAIKFESEIMGWPDRGSGIPDINFAHYARSVGVRAQRVSTLREFRRAFTDAIGGNGPYLIDARCILNDAPVQAGKVNWRQVAGFFLAWSREGRDAFGTFAEVTRAVVAGKLLK